MAQWKRICLPKQETPVWFLNWEDPLRRKWQPTSVFLAGKSHGQRSLVGYSPWGHKRIRRDLAIKHYLLLGVKTFPVSSTLNYQVPSLTFPFWMYQVQGVQNASSDFSSETCLSLTELSHLSQQCHCSPSCWWQEQIYPWLSLALSSHTYFINESLLILSPSFICTLFSSSCLHCSFCGRTLTSCLDDGNSLLVGPILSSPVSSCCRVIMLHPTYKCLDSFSLYFAGKSSNSLP